MRGQTPVVERPERWQAISAASVVGATGAFGFCLYDGELNAVLFVGFLQRTMNYRRAPIHVALDSLPAHKKAATRDYVALTEGRLALHVLPGQIPALSADELVWSHVSCTGAARRPLRS